MWGYFVLKQNFKKLLLFVVIYIFFNSINAQGTEAFPASAYLRVKNEINTIEACLNSIDGVFDRIVIIHSNEKDDGSVAFMNAWCEKRPSCEIHEYPHAVIPSHDKRYKGSVPYENTLAAYNQFGLQFFKPNEWVVKIDADQVYLTNRLKEFVEMMKKAENDNKHFSLKGYNTFSHNGVLVKYKLGPFNGENGDSYAIQRKNFSHFQQKKYFEYVVFNKKMKNNIHSQPVWFHFMKTLKGNGVIKNNDEAKESEILFLSVEEKVLFNTHIRPLLKNSPYYHLKLER